MEVKLKKGSTFCMNGDEYRIVDVLGDNGTLVYVYCCLLDGYGMLYQAIRAEELDENMRKNPFRYCNVKI